MSRIGKKPVEIPSGVTVEIKDGIITVRGKLGTEKLSLLEGIDVELKNNQLLVITKPEENKELRAFHGLSRSMINNMVIGVSRGFEKDLEILGVGYRAIQQAKNIQFQLGYSHPIVFSPPEGITLEVLEPTKVRVKGINKQQVGQIAANIRKLRPPEPYKGKGIRYRDEYIRRKAGKTGK